MRARILLLFLLVSLLPVSSEANPSAAAEKLVVVLDAGHGGNDPGAHYAGVYEKDLTLKVVLRLGKKIEQNLPHVKVVYTRKTDKALAQTKIEDLQKRADIANAANGELFLSVHVNAAKSTSAKGVETLIMGETPKEQRYNENALYESNRDDLLDMSNATEREAAIIRARIQNMQFTYGEYSRMLANCIQQYYTKAGRHSRGVKPQLLRVLYATNMPGVLTEIGFLSNKEEAAYLKSEKGINQIVDALYQSVRDYTNHILAMRATEEAATAVRPSQPAQPKAESKAEPKKEAAAEPKAKSKGGQKSASKTEPAATPTAGQQAGQDSDPRLFDWRLYAEAKEVIEQEVKPKQGTESAPAQPVKKKASFYTVQIMASRKPMSINDADFKEYRGRVIAYKRDDAYPYKYGVGRYSSQQEAVEAVVVVKRHFDCFVVEVSEQQLIPAKKR